MEVPEEQLQAPESTEREMGESERIEEVREKERDNQCVLRKPTPFDWADDVDAFIGIILPDVPHDPIPIICANPSSVDTSISLAPVENIEAVQPTPIVQGPRDFSALRSGARNPWSSISHRNRRSYTARPHRTYLGPEPLQNLQSDPWHPHRSTAPPQYSHSRHTEPPVPIFQVIQHPHGISSTKPKITKNIPVFPIPSVETQKYTRVSHCVCGAILPVHRSDQGSWRLMDSRRGTFGSRFSRRFRSRFWDRERRRSHFHGGYME